MSGHPGSIISVAPFPMPSQGSSESKSPEPAPIVVATGDADPDSAAFGHGQVADHKWAPSAGRGRVPDQAQSTAHEYTTLCQSLWDIALLVGCKVDPETLEQAGPGDPMPVTSTAGQLVIVILVSLNAIIQILMSMAILNSITSNPYDPPVLAALSVRRDLQGHAASETTSGQGRCCMCLGARLQPSPLALPAALTFRVLPTQRVGVPAIDVPCMKQNRPRDCCGGRVQTPWAKHARHASVPPSSHGIEGCRCATTVLPGGGGGQRQRQSQWQKQRQDPAACIQFDVLCG